MRQKNLLTALALLGVVMAAEAQQVSPESAAGIARSFWTSGSGGRRLAPSKVKPLLSYTERTGDEVQFYVFNNGGSNGFVVVGGDERVPQVLGFSNDGVFDYEIIPDNMKWWLSQYKAQIHNAIASGAPAAQFRHRVLGTVPDVTPLLTSTWNQDAPYNSLLPSLGAGFTGEKALATGCVATAMAQVMNYYGYPDSGIGGNSFTGINDLTFEADFGSTNYDWTYMLDNYSGGESDRCRQAVGTLMYHCGVAVNMKYGQFTTGGSTADTRNATIAMVKYFGYDRGIHVQMRDYMTDDDWEQYVYEELAGNRPVIYSGVSVVSGDEGGHAFVCDGYRNSDGMFHINWGWGGFCDGYFLLTGSGALKPGGSGAGGAGTTAEYTVDQFIVAGIQPDAGNPVKEHIVANMFDVLSTSVTSGSSLPVKIEFHNYSCIQLTIPVGLRFTNTVTGDEVIQEFSLQKFSMAPMTEYYSFDGTTESTTLLFPTTFMEEGTYHVCPVFKNLQGEWTDMMLGKEAATPVVEITAPATNLYLVSEPVFGSGNYITRGSQPCTIRIKNNTSDDITTNIAVWFYADKGGGSYEADDHLWAPSTLFKAGEVTELNLNKVQDDALTEGTKYTIVVQDNKNNYNILAPFNLYVNVVPSVKIDYTMSEHEWGTFCLPFDAEVPTGLHAYTVSSYSGSVLDYTEADFIDMNTPYILNGTPGNYSFEGPSTPAGTYTKGLLVGTTAADASIPVGSYILQNQASGFGFYQTATSRTASQYRAYLTLPTGSTTSFFRFTDEESTGIDGITPVPTQKARTIYNLQGQKLNSLQRGVNIVNGKKVLIK